MAGNVVPPMLALRLDENIPKGVAEILQKATYPRTLLTRMVIDFRNFLKIWISVVLGHGLNSNSSQLETF